ncbi:amino acid/amide ABC transporter membrane protein 1, HAAT family [Halomonas sp. HL-93]|nr:amino acid/amide ABC transporter membrane protein 1, HAAT family [Halomonas sp. HL-93]SNY97628.1 amino acid/amide ABC transporter membrane protein 1, HAAT family [Halomonas sp. hl-4]
MRIPCYSWTPRVMTRIVTCLFISLLAWLPMTVQAQEDDGQALLEALDTRSFDDKSEAITAIIESEHERADEWLQALLDSDLQRLKDDGRFVIAVDSAGLDVSIEDALTGESMDDVTRRDLDRLTINNALRSQLRSAISLVELYAGDRDARLDAAEGLIGDVEEDQVEPLTNRLDEEPSAAVRDRLNQALAVYRLNQGDVEAVEVLSGSLNSNIRVALNRAAQSDDPLVVDAATAALADIEQNLKISRAAETLYFGLSMGSVLVLAAIGLAITFGVMGVINMAHGELIMLGAYTTWAMQQLLPGQPGLALILAIPAGFMVSALVGVAIERGVIQFLKGRPLETLLATFGVSLILQQLVRTVISPQNRTVITPEWMSGSLVVNDALSLTLNRMYVIGFALVVFAGLILIMRRTRLGLEVRAVTQNRNMARSMGIRATRVDIMTFALGSGVAGLAGVALSQLTNVGPNLGQSYIIDSFMVVVFGGVGNLWGTLVAGMSLGVINQVLEPWAGAVLAKIIVLVFIILFIQKRPRGLFPQKGRAAEG